MIVLARVDPELLPHLDIFVILVLLHFFQGIEDLLRQPFSNLGDVPIFLQPLTRNIEWQVGGIDYAANEAQIGRQQFLAMFHDQNAPYVQMQPEFAGCIEQIEPV